MTTFNMEKLPTDKYLKTDVLDDFEPWVTVHAWGLTRWKLYDLTESMCRDIAEETGISPNAYELLGKMINIIKDPELKHWQLFTLLESLVNMGQAVDSMHNFVRYKYEKDVQDAHKRDECYKYHDYKEFAQKHELKEETIVERAYWSHYAYVLRQMKIAVRDSRGF